MGFDLSISAEELLDTYAGYQLEPEDDPDALWRMDVITGSSNCILLIENYLCFNPKITDEMEEQMNRTKLLQQINEWHEKDKHKKIIDAIEALPREECDYELTCLLARAYNNVSDPHASQLEKAVSLLESVQEDGKDDPLWHYRLGYALYYLRREEEALGFFRQAAKLNPDDPDAQQFIGWCEAAQKTKVVIAERFDDPDGSDLKENNMDTDAVKQELKALCRNAIHLNIGGKGESVLGGTRFGGVPDVPADFVWPVYEGTSFADNEVKKRPLSFLAQFNCADLATLDTEGLLPKTGLLSFFYEMETACWGFDPKDAGCARVFWFEDTSAIASAQVPEDLASDFRFPMLKINMEKETSFIDGQDFRILHENGIDWSTIGGILEELGIEDPENSSKLLGWPNLIQDSIMLECEFASSGYYLGDPEGWAKVPQEERESKKQTSLEDWRLLFQLDTVESRKDNFELMFGDCGRIYFCIRKEDLLARRFDRVWLILQCY